MKSYTIFVCERCGYESPAPEYVELCEAKHFGLLNLEDYRKWKLLDGYAKACTAKLATTSNSELCPKEEDVYNELLDFEKEHKMKV